MSEQVPTEKAFVVADAIEALDHSIEAFEERFAVHDKMGDHGSNDISFWIGWYSAKLDYEILPRISRVIAAADKTDLSHFDHIPDPFESSEASPDPRVALERIIAKLHHFRGELLHLAESSRALAVSELAETDHVTNELAEFLRGIQHPEN